MLNGNETFVRVKEMQPGVIDSTCLPLQITPASLKHCKRCKVKRGSFLELAFFGSQCITITRNLLEITS